MTGALTTRNRAKKFAAGSARAAFALAACALTGADPALAQAVDTSEWACEFCPFEEGYRAEYEIGAISVSEDSAYFGDATGLDEEGLYADLDGTGTYVSDNYRLRWTLEDLGLDSRFASLNGGRQGSYDYTLAYRELPRRRFDTTVSVFGESGGVLSLPSGWVRAPVTGGFTALASSLRPQNVESDRSIFDVGGRYLPSTRWSVSADYRRQEQDGVKMYGASYYTNAGILPAPIDYVTDEVDLGLRYAGNRWVLALGWYLSDFENSRPGFDWEHPFTTAAGAEFSALAQPPDSRFQQLSLSGSYSFPLYAAYASFSAAVGEIDQDEAFLAYTTNANLAPDALPRADLAGSVDTTRIAFSISAKPVARARVRMSYRYDERDNGTAQDLWNRVIADSFVSGEAEANLPYSYKRAEFRVSGDYDVSDTLRVSAGAERRETDRDFQEVAEQSEDSGWGRVRWRPHGTLQIDLRGGTAKRDIDRYDENLAATFGQNPLLRKYHLAYRYREYAELTAAYSPASLPVSVTVDALFADDSYSQSQLGMRSADETRIAADLSFSLSAIASVYLNAGMEDIESVQFGSDAFAAADWRASHDDDFTTLGAGLRVRNIGEKVDLAIDYTRSDGGSEIVVDSAPDGLSEFPELATELDFARLSLSYRRSEQLAIDLNVRYQRFRAEDWALEGVRPATLPTVLGLGAYPYSPEVFIVGIGFRYRLEP